MTEQFIAGIVGSPFGLKGFVKVKPLSGEIDHLLKLKTATLRHDGKEQSLTIEEISAIPPAVAIRFAGFNTPEAAKALHGAQLIVDRKDAAPLQAGEFYVEDLKGLTVYAAESPARAAGGAAKISGIPRRNRPASKIKNCAEIKASGTQDMMTTRNNETTTPPDTNEEAGRGCVGGLPRLFAAPPAARAGDSAVFADKSNDERIVGHIVNIIEGGGGDLAEIRLQNGEVKLVPFRKEFFPAVDLAKKQATLQNLWVLE